MAGGENRRRHQRYAYRAKAKLIRGKREYDLRTLDISFSGLFLSTDEAPPLRELVKIQLVLPSDGQEISLLGMAVYRAEPGGSRPAGSGVMLYGLDPSQKGRWERFVQEVRQGRHGSGPTDDLPPPSAPAPVKEYRPELRVQVPSYDALTTLRDRDLVRGRTFVGTDLYLEPDVPVVILFAHPESSRVFRVEGRVMRQIQRPGVLGLALTLEGLDDKGLERFDEFVEDEVHVTVDVDFDVFDDFDDEEDAT